MAPKPVLGQNRSKSKSIFIKKLNRFLIINNNLRKRIEELSDKNKELSRTRNCMLLEKFALQHENNTIRNLNIQLYTKQNIMHRKLGVLERTIQSCIPSLVTMSQCIPSMLESVHEMSKFEVKDINNEKKEKQTETVRPMIHGKTITQPTNLIKQLDMSPIIESPSSSSERTPRRSSYRSSPHCKLNMEPYVRLKDVTAMLKNSKAVPNESPKHQLNESLGEDPSWLNTQENQIQCSNSNTNATKYSNSSPKLMTSNEAQADVSIIASTSSSSMNNTSNEIEVRHSDLISSPIDASILRNITCRKRNKRSSETSIASDFNDSTSSSVRPSRSARKKINYKEKSLGCKLRR
ncbi:hypothetical protein QTP88_008614 [Uroleucon formosanum]